MWIIWKLFVIECECECECEYKIHYTIVEMCKWIVEVSGKGGESDNERGATNVTVWLMSTSTYTYCIWLVFLRIYFIDVWFSFSLVEALACAVAFLLAALHHTHKSVVMCIFFFRSLWLFAFLYLFYFICHLLFICFFFFFCLNEFLLFAHALSLHIEHIICFTLFNLSLPTFSTTTFIWRTRAPHNRGFI